MGCFGLGLGLLGLVRGWNCSGWFGLRLLLFGLIWVLGLVWFEAGWFGLVGLFWISAGLFGLG